MAAPPITLGQLIAELKDLPVHQLLPYLDDIHSYRGAENALGLEFDASKTMTAKELLRVLRAAEGDTFFGYAGGQFEVSLNTPVWQSKYGLAAGSPVYSALALR